MARTSQDGETFFARSHSSQPMRTHVLKRAAAALVAVATAGTMLLSVAPVRAASFSSVKDTMSRLSITTNADHVIRATLPSGVDFDHAGGAGVDVIAIDFPGGFQSSASGTWVTADFTFNDGTARTVNDIDQGSGVSTVSCTDGANNVGLAIDTLDEVFRVIPCGTSYSASTSTTTFTLTIDGTTTGGTLLNPGTAGSNSISLTMDDENVAAAHSSTFAVAIVDSDQVTITATVDPSITFDIDIDDLCDTETSASATPYALSLGTLSSSSITTASNSICLELDTNATSGAFVTVQGSGAVDGLESVSASADIASTYSGAFVTLAAGSEGYGLCVQSTSTVTGSASGVAPYNQACDGTADTFRVGGVDSAAPQNILTTANAPVDGTANSTARIRVKAAIPGSQPAANDYTDTLTFIATGTY